MGGICFECSLRLLQVVVAAVLIAGWTSAAAAESAAAPAADLMELDLEALSQVTVTSVSKKEQKLTDVAAAVTVLSNEDIQRSGATSIPEALRMVPGLDVAQINQSTWAISSRGFNGEYANKLLVLMDGRSLYNPLFAGTYWDSQDTLMEDIDRIEVIRGPGATVWGANAVNGVINVVTKRAKDTQGALLYAGTGSEKDAMFGFRYGGKIHDELHARVYGKLDHYRDSVLYGTDAPAYDSWWKAQGGMRVDWDPSDVSKFTFQGDFYSGTKDAQAVLPRTGLLPAASETGSADLMGGNFVARWDRTLSDTSALSVQAFYDHSERQTYFSLQNDQECDIFDVELQHNFGWGERQSLMWGLGYRFSTDSFEVTTAPTFLPVVGFEPTSLDRNLFSGFVQDEIAIVPDHLTLTVGSKFEHNDYTGFEYQPSGRLAWKPADKHTIWGSVSRAVRTPSRLDDGYRATYAQGFVPFPPPGSSFSVRSVGNTELDSEVLLAYELGYRVQPFKVLSLDLAGFYNVYDDLIFTRTVSPFPNSLSQYDNVMEGEAYGAELALTFQPCPHWRLIPTYSLQMLQLHARTPAAAAAESHERRSPIHQVGVRSQVDLLKTVQFDLFFRYVDGLPGANLNSVAAGGLAEDVPCYVTFDTRLAWKPTPQLELAVVGQNLCDDRHPEFYNASGPSYEVERSVYGKVTFSF